MIDTELTIIIPVFNSGLFLRSSLFSFDEWQKKLSYRVGLILVNDGSTDGTGKILNDFISTKDYVEVISLSKNMGKGYALRCGFLAAKSSYVAFTDSDLPYGLEIFEPMLEKMRDKQVEFFYGSRSNRQSFSNTDYGFIRKIGSMFFSNIVRCLMFPRVFDTQCGLKMMKKEFSDLVVKKSIINRFAFDIELFAIAISNHLLMQDFPVVLKHHKESSVRLFKDTILMFIDIMQIRIKIWQGFYVRD